MRLDHITSSRFNTCKPRYNDRPVLNAIPSHPKSQSGAGATLRHSKRLPGGHSGVEPPDPFPNSEVKRTSADGSVHPHARVGHRQGFYFEKPGLGRDRVFYCASLQKSRPLDGSRFYAFKELLSASSVV